MTSPTGPDAAPSPRCLMTRQDCRYRLRIVLDHRRASLPSAVKEILKVAGKAGYKPDLRADLEIALTEALANALIHGNEEGAGKNVFVRCYASRRMGLLIIVRDEGQGFDHEHVPDPRDADRMQLNHGRGVFLMRQLMDECVYRKGGTEVLMFKALA